MTKNETLRQDLIEDLEADLAYHERHAELIRARLARTIGTNTVPAGCACPGCGERDADRLVWIGDEGDRVRCDRCGLTFDPNATS
ncbi:MAG: hypothetical protein Q9O74_12170 [Planctomycetota bacterium]|nr:hypothetical protein [Planctomycetota bacterium]